MRLSVCVLMPRARPSTSGIGHKSQPREDTAANRKRASAESQTNGASQKMSQNDINELVNNTIVYVLSQDHHKMPIKRTEITKHAMKTPGKMYNTIMKEVQIQLEQIYGLELVDLDHTSQRYALLNKLDSKYTSGVLTVPLRLRMKNSLLMTILSLIFMSQNVVAEADMWNFLKKLRLVNDEPQMKHPLFGDVRKLVTQEFVRQLYLEYRDVAESNPPVMEFHWGQRAIKEVSKREILNFVCKMHSDMKPEKWTTQWQDIKREEDTTQQNGN